MCISIFRKLKYFLIFIRYRKFTIIPMCEFMENLALIEDAFSKSNLTGGCIIECGTWRGGMAAALVHLLGPKRKFHFFDSFQGLPPATEEDGPDALRWQQNRSGPRYFSNCKTSRREFDSTMRLVPHHNCSVNVYEGWFEDTFLTAQTGPISVLRLDADWYNSTMLCLETFWPRLLRGAIVIIDDYYCWEGCRKAVHQFLAREKAVEAIRQSAFGGVAYILKQ